MAIIHPGKRKANPDATCNGKPRIKGWSKSKLENAIEQLSSARGRSAVGKNKEKARYLKEIERRFAWYIMNSLLIYLMIIFNDKVIIEIPYDSMESCRIAEASIDEDPRTLYYTERGIDRIEYGCIEK